MQEQSIGKLGKQGQSGPESQTETESENGIGQKEFGKRGSPWHVSLQSHIHSSLATLLLHYLVCRSYKQIV